MTLREEYRPIYQIWIHALDEISPNPFAFFSGAAPTISVPYDNIYGLFLRKMRSQLELTSSFLDLLAEIETLRNREGRSRESLRTMTISEVRLFLKPDFPLLKLLLDKQFIAFIKLFYPHEQSYVASAFFMHIAWGEFLDENYITNMDFISKPKELPALLDYFCLALGQLPDSVISFFHPTSFSPPDCPDIQIYNLKDIHLKIVKLNTIQQRIARTIEQSRCPLDAVLSNHLLTMLAIEIQERFIGSRLGSSVASKGHTSFLEHSEDQAFGHFEGTRQSPFVLSQRQQNQCLFRDFDAESQNSDHEAAPPETALSFRGDIDS